MCIGREREPLAAEHQLELLSHYFASTNNSGCTKAQRWMVCEKCDHITNVGLIVYADLAFGNHINSITRATI